MAKDDNILIDGISVLPDGMNSGLSPQLLEPTQTSFSTNATHRGGYIRNRPGFRKVILTFEGGLVVQQRFENGLWQGGAFFKSEYGTESLVCSIGGRLFEVVPNPDTSLNTAIVYERTIVDSGGNYDTNSSGNAIAWLWQSERWMIINDGQSLPIFFDGATSRRSYGSTPVSIGLTAVDWVAPAVGASTTITLTAPYTGPVNQTVHIDGQLYQVNASSSGYEATLKNLSEAAGTAESANDQLLIPSNFLSQTTAVQASGLFGGIYVLIIDISDLPSPALVMGEVLTARISGTNYVSAPIVNIINPQRVMIGPVPSGTVCPALSPVYRGYFDSSGIAGVLSAGFNTGVPGSSSTATLTNPYNGVLPQKVVINGGLFEITAVNNTFTPGVNINITNIDDTAGNPHGPATPLTPGALFTVPELPVGKMGAYGMGRNVMCLADGRSFIYSDIVGATSGSPSVANRDAVLKVTENTFLAGGGVFVVPGNVGDITSMTFTANLDASLGQGPLQIGTPTTIFSCQVPVDRTTWQTLENPILTVSLKGKGPLGQYGTILINSDTLFRALDGLGSLILARRDFTAWGNVPISREMQRVIDEDNVELLGNATAVQFDNRLLVGCFPFRGPLGVYHQGFIALNFDPVSSLRGKQASIYDGLWTGLQAFQLISGKFSGDERGFAFCFETFTNKIILTELHQSGEGEFDNGTIPITWSFESASLFNNVKNKGPFDEIELKDGEIYLSDIEGVVHVESWYRPAWSECWIPWHSFSICGTPNDPKQFRSRLGLGQPTADDCEPTNNRPYRIGVSFQVRFQFTGACKFRGAIFKASRSPETFWAKAKCEDLCAVLDENGCEECKEQGECLQFDLVFYNLNGNKVYSNVDMIFTVTCPDGTSRVVNVPSGTVNFTLPFPPDYTGEYPPLVLGCSQGGNIVRTIPSGSTQEEIDVIVEGMISECAQAIAEASVDCSSTSPTQFENEEVYFLHPCEEPAELAFSGSLPAWITLDVANSRLVGAAGMFTGNTQSEANLVAQHAIDDFGNIALNEETLTCGCPTPVSFPTINLPANADPLSMATDTANGRIWITDGLGGGNLSVYVVDAATNTLVTTIDVTTFSGIWQLVYDSVNGQMVGIGVNGSLVFFNTTTYAVISSIAALLHANGVQRTPLAYDNEQGNILAVDVGRTAGTRNVRLVSGATRAEIASNDQAVTLWSPVYVTGFNQFAISIQSDTTLRYIDSTSLAITSSAIVFANAGEYMRFGYFDPLTSLIFANTRDNALRGKVRAVDAFSDSVVGTLSGANVPANQWAIEQMVVNTCTGVLYLNDFSRLFTFSTSTFAQTSSTVQAGSDALGHSEVSNLVYVGIDSNNVIQTV